MLEVDPTATNVIHEHFHQHMHTHGTRMHRRSLVEGESPDDNGNDETGSTLNSASNKPPSRRLLQAPDATPPAPTDVNGFTPTDPTTGLTPTPPGGQDELLFPPTPPTVAVPTAPTAPVPETVPVAVPVAVDPPQPLEDATAGGDGPAPGPAPVPGGAADLTKGAMTCGSHEDCPDMAYCDADFKCWTCAGDDGCCAARDAHDGGECPSSCDCAVLDQISRSCNPDNWCKKECGFLDECEDTVWATYDCPQSRADCDDGGHCYCQSAGLGGASVAVLMLSILLTACACVACLKTNEGYPGGGYSDFERRGVLLSDDVRNPTYGSNAMDGMEVSAGGGARALGPGAPGSSYQMVPMKPQAHLYTSDEPATKLLSPRLSARASKPAGVVSETVSSSSYQTSGGVPLLIPEPKVAQAGSKARSDGDQTQQGYHGTDTGDSASVAGTEYQSASSNTNDA